MNMAAKYHKLSHDRLLSLVRYNPETGKFFWIGHRRGVAGENTEAGCMNGYGYWQVKVDMSLYIGHRLAWFYMHGTWPSRGLDHINGVKTDNRIANLREATPRENNINIKTSSRSGFRGVYWKPLHKKYEARLRTTERRIHLGHFVDPVAAAKAYDAAARKHHGEFAKLNFPNA